MWSVKNWSNNGPPKIYFIEGLDNTLPTMGQPLLHCKWLVRNDWSKVEDWGYNRSPPYPSILKLKKMRNSLGELKIIRMT